MFTSMFKFFFQTYFKILIKTLMIKRFSAWNQFSEKLYWLEFSCFQDLGVYGRFLPNLSYHLLSSTGKSLTD